MSEENPQNNLSVVKETINHPDHYGGKNNIYEAIKVIEAWELGFCLGNTIKYISRAGKKDKFKELEDLKKAKWYLEREISNLEMNEKKPSKSLTSPNGLLPNVFPEYNRPSQWIEETSSLTDPLLKNTYPNSSFYGHCS